MQSLIDLLASTDDLMRGLSLWMSRGITLKPWHRVTDSVAWLSANPVEEAANRASLQLRALKPQALTEENIAPLANQGAPGVYLLFHKGVLLYVGKADNKKGLAQRLRRHVTKLSNRCNLDISDITFKALFVDHIEPGVLEAELIDRVKLSRQFILKEGQDWDRANVDAWLELNAGAADRKSVKAWLGDDASVIRALRPAEMLHLNGAALNNSGFGSNDPGSTRDSQENSVFDRYFPLNLEAPFSAIKAAETLGKKTASDGTAALKQVLEWVRQETGVTVRVPEKAGEFLETHEVRCSTTLLLNSTTLSELFYSIGRQLPLGVELRVLPGRAVVHLVNEAKQECLMVVKGEFLNLLS